MSIIGKKVLVKFYLSRKPDGSWAYISRTMGKFSVVDKQFHGEMGDKEFWLCTVVEEIKPGQNSGAFVLKPHKKIEVAEIRKLIPGFYEIVSDNGILMFVPKIDKNAYWMLSRDTRRAYAKKGYATAVPLDIELESQE